jgi:chorismate mutase/prephenate dehydratase
MPMPSRTRKINKSRRAVTPRGATAAPAATAAAAAAAKATATAAVDLVALRAAIDAVDEQLHQLLNERARLAQRAGISKHQDGHTVDYYRPEREAEVLRQALHRNSGPLRNEEIVRLFREIMSACLAQEEPLKVAFLGPEGTFTQQAVFSHFGHSVRALALPTVDEVFQEVEAGNADFGIVAIENSSEGTITNTLDRFLGSPLHICGEVELRIHHCLMGKMDALPRVLRVCSHSQALAQCRGWLDEHLPDAERVPVASNAEGARRARDEQGSAAIAGETAPRSTASTSWCARSRIARIMPRASWCWDASCCARVAPIAPRCCCRSAIPSLLARCIGCSSHWRATASA